jgi:hypothetical protein
MIHTYLLSGQAAFDTNQHLLASLVFPIWKCQCHSNRKIQQSSPKREVLTKVGNSNKALFQIFLKIFQVLYANAEPEQAWVCTGV